MNADFEGQKKSEAAPKGPPHDLVHERGQKPAEAPQGNLAASHKGNIGAVAPADQAEIRKDPKAHALLTKYLPAQRLARYRPAASDGEIAASDIYLWNCDLTEAFQLPLHMAEVSCRNTIHSALLFRSDRWYAEKTFRDILDPARRNDLDRAIDTEEAQHGRAFDCHHLVSALTFGFWEHLTTKRFERYLFPRGIQKNFKHAPADKRLHDLRNLIETVRRWRNRIAHHNAIFDKSPAAKYADILELISWTSPELRDFVAHRAKVHQVINARPRGK